MKARLRTLDHAAIYLLIAGTYTPFLIGAMRGAWGWSLFAAEWALATIGIVAKLRWGFRWPRLSTWMYVGMGWLALIAVRPLIERGRPRSRLADRGRRVLHGGRRVLRHRLARAIRARRLAPVRRRRRTCHVWAVLRHG